MNFGRGDAIWNAIKLVEGSFRGHSTKKNGRGIGLYISKNFIERNMSGNLTVWNEEEGAAFCLELSSC
jgi:signal transduction histidine kinase